MDLSIHLHELQQNPDVGEATQVLLHELKKRSKKITDPGDSDHEPLFLVATALDPRYKLLLNPVQRDSAKKELLMTLKQEARGKNGNSSASEGELTSSPLYIETSECEEPPKKKTLSSSSQYFGGKVERRT